MKKRKRSKLDYQQLGHRRCLATVVPAGEMLFPGVFADYDQQHLEIVGTDSNDEILLSVSEFDVATITRNGQIGRVANFSQFRCVVMSGLDGDDLLYNDSSHGIRMNGNDGEDILVGGESDDWLVGGADADQVFGRAGSDLIVYELPLSFGVRMTDLVLDGGPDPDFLVSTLFETFDSVSSIDLISEPGFSEVHICDRKIGVEDGLFAVFEGEGVNVPQSSPGSLLSVPELPNYSTIFNPSAISSPRLPERPQTGLIPLFAILSNVSISTTSGQPFAETAIGSLISSPSLTAQRPPLLPARINTTSDLRIRFSDNTSSKEESKEKVTEMLEELKLPDLQEMDDEIDNQTNKEQHRDREKKNELKDSSNKFPPDEPNDVEFDGENETPDSPGPDKEQPKTNVKLNLKEVQADPDPDDSKYKVSAGYLLLPLPFLKSAFRRKDLALSNDD